MIRRLALSWILRLGSVLLLYLGIHAAIQPRIVLGQSMEPALHAHEYLLLDRLSYLFHGPQRGDIVVFNFPTMPNEEYIKRVIGLPGDHVVVQGGHVFVNGTELTERYIANAPDYTDNRVVPPGFLYVLGDNRDNSNDSHEWGLLPRAAVLGRAVLAFWPLSDLSILQPPSYPGVRTGE